VRGRGSPTLAIGYRLLRCEIGPPTPEARTGGTGSRPYDLIERWYCMTASGAQITMIPTAHSSV
jgi:hypothetical protein